MELNNCVALVTGGSKGIGYGIAEALAHEGARLVISARGTEDLATAASRLRERGAEVCAVAGDVGEVDDAERMVAAATEKWGRLDLVVNNAGFGRRQALEEMSVQEWDRMFQTNVRGVFLVTRRAIPIMREQGGGTIVNISSLAGKNDVPTMPCYAATKWALDGLTKSLMGAVRGDGIRMVLVHPGSTVSSFSDDPTKKDREARILHPDDIAEVLVAALRRPDRAMVSEIDLRPTNP